VLVQSAAVANGDDLRELMRSFPSGVAVLSVDDEEDALAITIGSLVSLSLEPPLVGISIGLDSSLHAPLQRAGRFVASLLAGDQAGLAQHFARSVPPIALWAGVPTRKSELPEPLLDGALAWLECRIVRDCWAGDHTFYVAELLSVQLGRMAEGLVYRDGGYHSS
jgi:flavin reductase (DIM6/NTAB) family NADH-FMN oxidoreductase RutF